MIDYSKPDPRALKGEWQAVVQTWDIEKIRQVHNDRMARDKPVCEKVSGYHHLPGLSECHGETLDVGCGNGEMLLGLFKYGRITKGIGIDISDVMIARAKQTAVNVGITEVQFIRIAFEHYEVDSLFDTIITNDILEHFFSVPWALDKLYSLIKPGGVLVGSVPIGQACDNKTHLHYFEKDDLLRLFNPMFIKIEIHKLYENHLYFACWKGNNETIINGG